MNPNQDLLTKIGAYTLQNRAALLTPEYRGKQSKQFPLNGLCYVVSEVYYHMEGKRLGYHPMVKRLSPFRTHWWLENDWGEAVDLVFGKRMKGGRRTAFLTRRPSRRAKIVIKAMRKV